MSSIATTSLSPSLDTATTSFEATTLPENVYLTSNLWIGLHDWGERTPSNGNGNGEMDSNWCQPNSPKAFMVIDDKGGEEHGLKLQLSKGEKKEKFKKTQFRVCLS